MLQAYTETQAEKNILKSDILVSIRRACSIGSIKHRINGSPCPNAIPFWLLCAPPLGDHCSLSCQGATSSPFLGTTQHTVAFVVPIEIVIYCVPRAYGKTISCKNEKARNDGNETREKKMTLPIIYPGSYFTRDHVWL